MPIGIGVQGGITRQVGLDNVSGLESDETLQSLQQIRTHLSQPGRDSGVLTLFNRTSGDREMTLERKSDFQLLFHKEERLDDTVTAMKSMLEKAGKHEAVVELENYLGSQGGNQNRIESSKMFEILNRHLPPLEKGSSLENLCTLAKIERTQVLGSGTYGSAYLVNMQGKEGVLKVFGEPQTLSLTRGSRPNEAMGSYLTSNNHPNYLEGKVNVAQPTFYVISVRTGGKREYQMVTPHAMRRLVNEGMQRGFEVRCHGLVMPKAKGSEGTKLIGRRSFAESEKKQFIGSMLMSIKGLNERGFVHRDVKPGNSFFDKKSETTTLVDTGTLFKTSKNQEKNPGTEYISGDPHGTPAFMHPRALQGEDHGTETDLYALAVSALQVDHPLAFDILYDEILRENYIGKGITQDWLRNTLDDIIKIAPEGRPKRALEALRSDIENPKKLAGFAMECFKRAGQPAGQWKERDWAQQQYSELLLHPGLQ